jgi:glyoxylate reductase
MGQGGKPHIFVSRRIPARGLERLTAAGELNVSPHDRQLSAEEIVAGASEADVLVSMLSDPLSAALLARLPRLRLIAQYAVGFNNIDLDYCRARGIAVSHTPGVLTEATADLTLALILAVTRRVVEGDRLLRAGGFKGWAPEFLLGTSLENRVLGIYGLGRIGEAVARRARSFGMELVYASRTRKPELERELSLRFEPFEAMLRRSDVVTIHTPLNEETRGRFNRAAFSLMKEGSYIINTARGQVIVEADLADALAGGRLAGAGLDVYEHEPSVEPRLLAMDNVVLLPHVGSATVSVREQMAMIVADNVSAFAEGRELPNRVV